MPKEYRTGLSIEAIRQSVLDNLYFHLGKVPDTATNNDWYMALAYTIRDRLMQRWIKTLQHYTEDLTVVTCLSDEFLTGPQLGIHLINLGIHHEVLQALQGLGLSIKELAGQEPEPGLGNSGIGMLAAGLMDSLTALEIPAIGSGIRYEFGIFDQALRDGWQVEFTVKWLRLGNPWEIARPEIIFDVKLGGRTETYQEGGKNRVRWIPDRVVKGMAYDTPVLGYGGNTVNLLRLWKAEAAESFDFQAFNTGDYFGAVMEKVVSENITKVLYPNDESLHGKELRLQQQYFFASCALQDMIRMYLQRTSSMDQLSERWVVQLNDTHPAIAVAELTYGYYALLQSV